MKHALALANQQNTSTDVSQYPEPRQNHILAALPVLAQRRLFPHLKLLFLPLGTVLKESGRSLQLAYFPVDSILSLLREMKDGASQAVLLVGNEGLVGTDVCMGGENSQDRVIVHSAGYAFGLAPLRCQDEFNSHSEIRMAVLRFAQASMTQMGQTAVCNRHHSIEQQLCRWLLMLLDRLPSNHLVMTHALVAAMLGVRRESVTAAAGKLQELGAIEYHRGHITVIDRAPLEKLACECYAVVKRETDRLLTLPGPDSLSNRFH